MNPSSPHPPKRHRIAPIFVLTAALASAAGAALTALSQVGSHNILGVPVPTLAFWQDQDFPAKSGWPVNKARELDRDPIDPKEPDLFLQQLRAQHFSGNLRDAANNAGRSTTANRNADETYRAYTSLGDRPTGASQPATTSAIGRTSAAASATDRAIAPDPQNIAPLNTMPSTAGPEARPDPLPPITAPELVTPGNTAVARPGQRSERLSNRGAAAAPAATAPRRRSATRQRSEGSANTTNERNQRSQRSTRPAAADRPTHQPSTAAPRSVEAPPPPIAPPAAGGASGGNKG